MSILFLCSVLPMAVFVCCVPSQALAFLCTSLVISESCVPGALCIVPLIAFWQKCEHLINSLGTEPGVFAMSLPRFIKYVPESETCWPVPACAKALR